MPQLQIQEKAARGERQFLPVQPDYITTLVSIQEHLFPYPIEDAVPLRRLPSIKAKKDAAGGWYCIGLFCIGLYWFGLVWIVLYWHPSHTTSCHLMPAHASRCQRMPVAFHHDPASQPHQNKERL
jgi:hypothetical protein